MPATLKKFRQRLWMFSMSAAYTLVPLLFHVVVAALVVRLLSTALWGEMVQVLVWTGLAGNVMAWGNKDFLLRGFSLNHATHHQNWQQSFGSRSLICVLAVLTVFALPLPVQVKSWIALYLIARFIYMSYDSLIIYRRNFRASILLELLGFVWTGSGILFMKPQSFLLLMCWFTTAELLKAVVITFWYRKEVLPLFFSRIDFSYFKSAFPFFLLYFTGALATKVDLIAATCLLNEESIAKYQVLMSFVLAVQLTIPILLLPYTTVIYRMPVSMIRKVSFRLLMVGMLLGSALIFAISLVLEFLYHFEYSPVTFLLAWLFAVPGFFFAPLIYRYFKDNRQQEVVRIAIVNILVSAVLIWISTCVFADTFHAILLAMALAQCCQALVYYFAVRKIS